MSRPPQPPRVTLDMQTTADLEQLGAHVELAAALSPTWALFVRAEGRYTWTGRADAEASVGLRWEW